MAHVFTENIRPVFQYFSSSIFDLLICFPLPTSNALQTVAVSQENSKLFSMFTPLNLLEEVASVNRKLFADCDNHSCV